MEKTAKKKIDINQLKNLLIESFTNIEKDNSIPVEDKISTIIHTTSIGCAIIAVQPIPFADALILTPIQMVMIGHMTNIMKADALKKAIESGDEERIKKVNLDTKDILLTISSAIGVGFLAQQGILGLYKTVVPFIAGVTTIPMVYAATFAIGKVAQLVISKQLKNEKISKDKIKSAYKTIVKEKEKEIKEKDIDLNTLNDEMEAISKKNQSYKDEINQLKLALEHMNSKIEEAYSQKNHLVSILQDNYEISNTIISAVQYAKKTIDISIYDISEYDLLELLGKKSKEGVEVRIVTDYNKTIGNFSNNINKKYGSSQNYYGKRTVNNIKNCFIQKNTIVKMYGNSQRGIEGINHQKDIIVDRQNFISGSANFTRAAFSKNKETVFFVRDEYLIQQKLKYFEELFNSDEVELLDKRLLN